MAPFQSVNGSAATPAATDPIVPPTPTLFNGMKMWFSKVLPSRKFLIERAVENGAVVVEDEHEADMKLVDHVKKQVAPGTHSYTFVERSIRERELQNPDDFRAGISYRSDRPVGTTRTAHIVLRKGFTPEEDQLLYNWVQPYREKGGAWKGNEIYKQLERYNDNHPYQSWRDRFMKKVSLETGRVITEHLDCEALGSTDGSPTLRRKAAKRPRVEFESDLPSPLATPTVPRGAVQLSRNIVPSQELSATQETPASTSRTPLQEISSPELNRQNEPPASAEATPSKQPTVLNEPPASANEATPSKQRTVPNESGDGEPESEASREGFYVQGLEHGFTKEELEMLLRAAPYIIDTPHTDIERGWISFASEYTSHSVEQWRQFFDRAVVPEFIRKHDLKSEAELHAYIDKFKAENASNSAEERSAEDQLQHELESSQTQENSNNTTVEARAVVRIPRKGVKCAQCQREQPLSERWTWSYDRPFCNQCVYAQSVGTMNLSSTEALAALHKQTPAHVATDETIDNDTIVVQYTKPNEGRKRASQSTTENSNSQNSKLRSPPPQTKSQTVEISDPRSLLQAINHSEAPIVDQFVSQEPPESGQRPPKSVLISQTTASYLSHYDTAPPPRSVRTPNPMFFTDDVEDESESEDSRHSSEASLIEIVDGKQELPRPVSSHGALSDTGSEYHPFEEMPERSQLWSTSPNRTRAKEEESDNEQDTIQISSSQRPPTPRQPLTILAQEEVDEEVDEDVDEGNDEELDDESQDSTEQQYETAQPNQRLDTQAILKQPMDDLDDVSEYILPPPDGGWEQLGIDDVDEDDIVDEVEEDMPEIPVLDENIQSETVERRIEIDAIDESRIPIRSSPLTEHSLQWHPKNSGKLPVLIESSESEEIEETVSEVDDSQQAKLDDQWFSVQESRFSTRNVDSTSTYRLISAAYLSTSMNTKLATTILKRMFDDYENVLRYHRRRSMKFTEIDEETAKSFLPENVRGCWTEEDDVELMSRSRKAIAKMETKHGEDSTGTRVQFLEDMYADK